VPKSILLTGAAGALGQVLAEALAKQGFVVCATDRTRYPGALPVGATFSHLDVADYAGVMAAAKGADAIVHFGAVPIELSFEEIAQSNLRGTNHIFEAALANRARVIFASSNHTVGYTERAMTIDEDAPMRPDGYYGVSKCYGEILGRMMFDKHGIESAHLRIGSCIPVPNNKRSLSLWLSYPDLVRLVLACLTARDLGCRAVWGISNNTRAFWRSKHWAAIGYAPQDDAEAYAGKVDMADTGPVAERFMGGPFAADKYSRATPGPAALP
jgi:uronate dehydrogenase